MQLTGTIPSCLLAAPGTLSQIDLSNNNLTGVIPDSIPANSSLFGMALSANNLTGTIPRTLGAASMLSRLELENNQLNGSMPVDFGAGMSLLNTVDLSGNALTGQCSRLGGNDMMKRSHCTIDSCSAVHMHVHRMWTCIVEEAELLSPAFACH